MARESRDAIIARKRSEIDSNGWTLWSFQYRKVLAEWRAMLPESNPVFVLCSDSPGARDPGTAPRAACLFRAGVRQALQPIPSGVSVPHPANAAGLGSAFVVDEVISFAGSVTRPEFSVEWFSSAKEWRSDSLPTRGEYLIRAPGPVRTRRIYAALRLRAPFLVEISV